MALYDRNGQLKATVEIKNKLGTSREWAAQLRRNILAHGESCRTDFWLLVTPDRLYLWKNVDMSSAPVPPTYEIDTEPIFVPYFKNAGVEPRYISRHAFEWVVAAWLNVGCPKWAFSDPF